MPRLDIYHETVKHALVKDGWTITHDPYKLTIGKKRLFADLGAEMLLSAEKGMRRIVVEIKSFTGASDVNDLEQAIGQYVLYKQIMLQTEPDRELFLAVTNKVANTIFSVEIGQILLDGNIVKVLVFDPESEVITQWLPN
ncbi:XisH family protein [Thiothrix fructosivorans]|jgi:hypothetical protein|uniref:XisH family protein n=1 Tax=Thiothrix fructosivorans TaxID=111770 RepID=A0A8B0SI67_9GAMM|nr:XisH family protein [Thiothrix fructosivorans]MBO0611622.1 XisH family protein [Thiothrix fructosivorans]QTX10714.1 XisH family protein [Thiothrix fructosivorans]